MHLMEEVMTAKMADEEKAQAQNERLRSLVEKLGTIGAPISDGKYRMALLRSLPKSYESLVMTLENLIDNLSFEDNYARIIREESRQAKNVTSDDSVTTGEKLLSSRDIVCTHCGKKGLSKPQC